MTTAASDERDALVSDAEVSLYLDPSVFGVKRVDASEAVESAPLDGYYSTSRPNGAAAAAAAAAAAHTTMVVQTDDVMGILSWVPEVKGQKSEPGESVFNVATGQYEQKPVVQEYVAQAAGWHVVATGRVQGERLFLSNQDLGVRTVDAAGNVALVFDKRAPLYLVGALDDAGVAEKTTALPAISKDLNTLLATRYETQYPLFPWYWSTALPAYRVAHEGKNGNVASRPDEWEVYEPAFTHQQLRSFSALHQRCPYGSAPFEDGGSAHCRWLGFNPPRNAQGDAPVTRDDAFEQPEFRQRLSGSVTSGLYTGDRNPLFREASDWTPHRWSGAKSYRKIGIAAEDTGRAFEIAEAECAKDPTRCAGFSLEWNGRAAWLHDAKALEAKSTNTNTHLFVRGAPSQALDAQRAGTSAAITPTGHGRTWRQPFRCFYGSSGQWYTRQDVDFMGDAKDLYAPRAVWMATCGVQPAASLPKGFGKIGQVLFQHDEDTDVRPVDTMAQLVVSVSDNASVARTRRVTDWEEVIDDFFVGRPLDDATKDTRDVCTVWRAKFPSDADRATWVVLGDIVTPKRLVDGRWTKTTPADAERLWGLGPYYAVRRELLSAAPVTPQEIKPRNKHYHLRATVMRNPVTRTFYVRRAGVDTSYDRQAVFAGPMSMSDILKCCMGKGTFGVTCGTFIKPSVPCDDIMRRFCRLSSMRGHPACGCINVPKDDEGLLVICHSPACVNADAYQPTTLLEWKRASGCPNLCQNLLKITAGGRVQIGQVTIDNQCGQPEHERVEVDVRQQVSDEEMQKAIREQLGEEAATVREQQERESEIESERADEMVQEEREREEAMRDAGQVDPARVDTEPTGDVGGGTSPVLIAVGVLVGLLLLALLGYLGVRAYRVGRKSG